MRAGGLLIVNADDWGVDQPTTDAAAECCAAGAVTSVSAMVFMADSERAAQLALERALAVGLHINLTTPFTDPAAGQQLQGRQDRLVAHFAGFGWRRWGASPTRSAAIEHSIADQLAEFRRLYGRDPTHFDGHHHIHQSLGVLAARAIPAGSRMRPSFTFGPGEKTWLNRAYRGGLNAILSARFATPRYFFSLRDLHPALGGSAVEEKLALSSGSAVEVMTHPAEADERAVLLDRDWLELIAQRNLGDYRDLDSARPAAIRRRWAAPRGAPRGPRS